MASRRPTAGVEDLRAVREQIAHLCSVIEQQQRRIEEQGQQAERHQVEIAALRSRIDMAGRAEDGAEDGLENGEDRAQDVRRRTAPPARRKPTAATSRRRLLASAGAAAAAATVALATSEQQIGHAAAADDGGSLLIGTANLGTAQTSLAITGTSTASPLFQVDASSSTNGNAIAIEGISAVSNGVGVAGISNGGASSSIVKPRSGSGFGATSGVYGACGSNGGIGVYGVDSSVSGYGVAGTSVGGYGVLGNSNTGTGVFGSSNTNSGVSGNSGSGYGVFGSSTGSVGVYAYSAAYLALEAAGTGRIYQHVQAPVGAPTSGSYAQGEQIRDANGDLWLCIFGGSPGNWVRAAHAVFGYTGGATSYLSKPIRLLDTRGSDPNALQNGSGPYTSGGSPYSLVIAGVNWMSVQVPNNAVGAIGKLTVISGASGSGFVALVPHGSGTPSTGTLPYSPSQIVATGFNVGLAGSPGSMDIYIGGTAVDIVIDLFAVVA
ncbi:MAG TPA: hypothetical protein VF120_16455 [Ktedonobacterales bacterium]